MGRRRSGGHERPTGATTHMLEQPPDIHPRAIGYDILAVALLTALK